MEFLAFSKLYGSTDMGLIGEIITLSESRGRASPEKPDRDLLLKIYFDDFKYLQLSIYLKCHVKYHGHPSATLDPKKI